MRSRGRQALSSATLIEPERDLVLQRIRAIPGVIQAAPLVEAQALVQGRGQTSGAIVRGMTPEDVRATKFIADNIKSGSLQGFGDGDYGGDLILGGDRLAASMGVGPGDTLTLTSPTGAETAFGSAPVSKAFTVAGTFSVGMSQYDESFIYMPLAQAQLFFGRGTSADQIEIKLDDPDRSAELRERSGWAWTRLFRRYDEYERVLAHLESERLAGTLEDDLRDYARR